MGDYHQQHQRVGRDEYNAGRNINQYQSNQYQGHHYQYINQQSYPSRKRSTDEILTAVALAVLGIVLTVAGFLLSLFGFGAFGTPLLLPDFLQMLLGVVGVILILIGFGIWIYVSIKNPELRRW